MTMEINFIKMEGCGNDFLLLDLRKKPPQSFSTEQIQYICDRNYGLGADGLIILYESYKADAKWDFFNSDGSMANMCGNASRCTIDYMYQTLKKSPLLLETKLHLVQGWITDNMPVLGWFSKDKLHSRESSIIKIDFNPIEVHFINTGVAHLVIHVKDILAYPIEKIGHEIQNSPIFKSIQPNVTFFQEIGISQIRATTYERGVYQQTMSCGTGSLASALVYHDLFNASFPISVQFPGGIINVGISDENLITLSGPTSYIGEMKISKLPTLFTKRKLYGRNK